MFQFVFDGVPMPPGAEPPPPPDPIFAFVSSIGVYLIFLGLILLCLPESVAGPIMRIAFGQRKTGL
jgi:hypothetical protein